MPDVQPLIVYDLDGTLIDTAPDLLDCLNQVVVSDGLDPIDTDALRKHVGFGGRVMLRNVYQMAGQHLPSEKLDRLVADFIALYASSMPGSSVPFDGLLTSMQNLKDAGCRFAICTNKTEFLANKLIDALNMNQWFDAITGQDTFSVRKPHKDHLLKTIAMAGGTPGNAIMVGDTPTDFSTARAAMVPCIGVRFGYFDEPIENYDISVAISHFDEMTPELIQAILNAKKTAR